MDKQQKKILNTVGSTCVEPPRLMGWQNAVEGDEKCDHFHRKKLAANVN